MGKHVKLENVRISYPSLFRPRTSAQFPTAEPKYEATLLVDSSSAPTIVQELTNTIAEVASAAGFTAGAYREPPWKANPEGIIEVSARSGNPVYVVDEYNNALNEVNNKIYAGCRVHAIISVYAYTTNGSGVTFGIEGVQFAADDQRLDNRPDMTNAFVPIAPAAPAAPVVAPAPVAPQAPAVAPAPLAPQAPAVIPQVPAVAPQPPLPTGMQFK